MAKTLRTAAIVVGAVALAATGIGAAGSIGLLGATTAAAGASAGTIAALGTIATIASVSQVAAAGLTLASSATAGRPVTLGNPTAFKIDKEAGVPIAIGRTFVGGNVVHRQYYDDPGSRMKNQRESWVTVYSLGPVKALGPLLVDRVAVSFNGSGAAVGFYSGNMWLDSQRGFSPEARALQAPTGYFPGWNASSKLSGLAADLWTLDFDSKGKKFPNGVPQRGRVVEGVYCWDPRQDSTYPGGMGPCRADDPATHIYTECPWLHALQHALGRVQNSQLVAGGGVKVSGVLVSTFVEAANVSDANGWKAGGLVYATTDNDWDILKMLAQAGGGEVFPIAGKLACTVAAPKVSIGTITSADIVGDIIAPSTASKRARRNTIIPRIRLESHGWEMVPLTAVKVDEYIALDGAPRPREITYALVQHAKQAAELATYELMNAREIDGIILPCNVAHLAYLPGDCVTLQIPEANLVDREVVLRTRELDPGNLGVTFSARTETAGKHPYALGKTTTPPPTPDLSVPSLDLEAPDNWSAASGTIESEGIPLPALIVQGEVDNAAAEAVVFEYRPVGAVEWWSAGTEAVNVVRKTIMQVAADTVYEVSVQYRVRGGLTDRQRLEPVAIGRTYVSWRDGIEGAGKPDDDATKGAVIGENLRLPGEETALPREELITGEGTSADTNAVGGRPAAEILADIITARDDADQAVARLDIQDRVNAAVDASQRQAEAGASSVAEALLRALAQINTQQLTVRDAGIYVDPATGQVRISGVERTAERVANAEFRLDGVNATLSLKADVNYVNQAIAEAVLDPSQIADLEQVFLRITAAEASIDGLNATVLLKADATTVSGLSATVASVSSGLDALSGVVSTKASVTELTALGTRVTSVEDSISVLGDVVGVRTEIRQARYRNDQADESLLRALAEADRAKRGVLQQIALVQQELSTRIVDGDYAEAQARLVLAAEQAATKAGLAIEQSARASGDAALVQSLNVLTASLNGVSSSLTAQIARIDAAEVNISGKASASSVTALSAAVDGANAAITNVSAVAAEANGIAKAIHGVMLDVNGRISGTMSENDGATSRFAILADVFEVSATGAGDRTEYRDGIWRVYGGGGTTLVAFGSPFGTANQFMWWFGPAMPLSECSEANAKDYRKVDGSAYFAGSLSLGTLRTAFTNPSLGASVIAAGDPFGSNGNTITVTASWTYRYVTNASYPSTTEGLAQFDANAAFYGATDQGGGLYQGSLNDNAPSTTLALERSVAGSAFTGVAAQSGTTRASTFQGLRPIVGDSAGWSTVQVVTGISFTFVDPQLSTAVRNYRAILTRGFNAPSNAQEISQAVTFTAVEQPNV